MHPCASMLVKMPCVFELRGGSIHSFIHSFSEYLLINYAVSLIFAKETVLNKTGMIKAIMDLVGKRER